MANFSLYTGSSIDDYFYEESSITLPSPTVASVQPDSEAVTWGSVGGVIGALMLVSGVLVALRRKLAAVDRFLATLQSVPRAALELLRPHQAQDASTSPMATPAVSGVPFRNATDSARARVQNIEMQGLAPRHCDENNARSLWV